MTTQDRRDAVALMPILGPSEAERLYALYQFKTVGDAIEDAVR